MTDRSSSTAISPAEPAPGALPAKRSLLQCSRPVLRLAGLFVLLAIAPLALLTYFTIHLADRAVVREVNARVRTTSAVTAALLRQQMQGVADLTASYASRPFLINALADGNPAAFDRDAINRQLTQLRAALPGNGGVFLTDTNCRLTNVEPATPAIVDVDFSFRDWCRGVKATGRPYVSEAYQTAIAGTPLVVAAAAMVRVAGGADPGRPLGILAVVYTLDAIRGFADDLAQAQGVQLTITDQRGTVLVGRTSTPDAGALTSAAADPRVRQALAGRSGSTRSATADGEALSAYAPVEAIGWTVTAEVPARQALAGVRQLRVAVLSVAGLLGVVLSGGMVVLARTLRLRREAERALVERGAQSRAILAATDAFVSMDASGIISAWNGQAHQVFGWTEAEALGRPLSETIIPADQRERHQRGMARFLATGDGPILNQRVEITALHRDGRQFPAELAVWPVRSEGRWSFNAFVHDITERKRAESDLATARDQALEASRLKSAFLANMSHEVRTPLNGVLGMTSLLLDTELDADQRQFAETVSTSGEALLGVLNDILDFSKIEAGGVDLESVDFDLRALVEDAVDRLSVAAHQKGVELAASLPADLPGVRGDPGRISQVITNLVGNAVKFTSAGEVLVEVTIEGGDDATVVIRFAVKDTGIGIAAVDHDAIFESFSQADVSSTRSYGGTGLGLAISRQLVELMGGHLEVGSELGQGSTFSFTLPLERGERAPAGSPTASLAGLHVLVVDDNATNRAILMKLLQSWGIRSETAAGAADALPSMAARAAAGEPFDAALLDFNMPDVDGIELARRIGADATLRHVKLVLLTSSVQQAEVGLAREAGIVGFLPKPVRRSQLQECLATVMISQADGLAPVKPSASDRPSTPSSRPVSARSRGTLLIVEDHAVNQAVARVMVEKLGYGCDVANNGMEALEALSGHTYDAVLMDCHMPEMDGFQATEEIRRREDGRRRVPIIAMTAGAPAEGREKCMAVGMDDYLSKPVKADQLEAALNRWLDGDEPRAARGLVDGAPRLVEEEGVLDAAQLGDLRELAASIDDPGFLPRLVDQYLSQVESQLGELRQAAGRGDATVLRAVAHSLKGASATVGASEVAAACAALEQAAAEGSPAAKDLGPIIVAVARATAALRVLVPLSPE